MDIKRVRQFIVLAETLNFRKAAERLHMAQPPLSVSMQKLEAELGTKLFVRGSTGVSLTASGHVALAEAKRLLFYSEQFVQTARSVTKGTGGTLRIGFTASSSDGILQTLLPAYRAAFPSVKIVLKDIATVQIIQFLEDRELDIGFVRTPLLRATHADLLPLIREKFIAALPRSNRLARKKKLALADLADEPFIMYAPGKGSLRQAALLACEQAGFVPHIEQEGEQIQTLLALVECGFGVALVPATKQHRYVHPTICYRELANYPSAVSIGLDLAYLADGEAPTVFNFRAIAKQLFKV